MNDPYSLFRKKTLQNGLTIYHAQWPGERWHSIGIIVHAGAREDPKGREGTAHFLEHVLSESTIQDINIFKDELADNGGGMNFGITRNFSTSYTFSAPLEGNYFERSMHIFGEMLFGLSEFRKVENERSIILSEFNRSYPLPARYKMMMEIEKILYPNMWLSCALSPLGTERTILKINHTHLLDFYNKYYVPKNMSIVSLGGLSIDPLVKIISESPFNLLRPGERVIPPTPTRAPEIPVRRLEHSLRTLYGRRISDKNSEILFVTTLDGNFTVSSVIIARNILSHYLFEKIRREKGLVYHVDVSYITYIYFYEFSVFMEGLSPDKEEEVEKIFDQSLDELIGDEELFKRFKKRHTNEELIPDNSPYSVRNGAMLDIKFYGKIYTRSEDIREARLVKFEEVQEVFKALKSERRLTSILKP